MNKSPKKSRKKLWMWAAGVLGLLILGSGVYLYTAYSNFTETLEEMHEPLERESSDEKDSAGSANSVEASDNPDSESSPNKKDSLSAEDPFSLLVLGVDEREGDKGRSDTMIVLTVNPQEGTKKMVSIPRDTYTEIIGHGTKDKINHAYAFGGIGMALETVENLLDIPIHYVVKVNMEAYQDIVDAVGGVEVFNHMAFDDFAEGNIQMNGKEALAYVRMRKEDPDGDFGRQGRQKQVLQSVIDKGLSMKSIYNYKDIFEVLSKNIRTNMTFDDMMEAQEKYRNSGSSLKQLDINNGSGKTLNGVWYYMMDENELKDIQNTLKSHLNL